MLSYFTILTSFTHESSIFIWTIASHISEIVVKKRLTPDTYAAILAVIMVAHIYSLLFNVIKREITQSHTYQMYQT